MIMLSRSRAQPREVDQKLETTRNSDVHTDAEKVVIQGTVRANLVHSPICHNHSHDNKTVEDH